MSIARTIARLGLPVLVTCLAASVAGAENAPPRDAPPGNAPPGNAPHDPQLSASASPPAHHARPHRHRRAAPKLAALPPAPPAAPASPGTTAAPVPDEAMSAPMDHTAPTSSVEPSVFQLHYPPQGDGYVTGSSPQAMDDRNAAKATGLEARIPLPQ